MTCPQRHDLVFLSARGQQWAWERRERGLPEDERWRKLFFTLPGICRAPVEELGEEMAALGFSTPVRAEGNRVRFASHAPREEILRIVTPWEISRLLARLPEPAGPVLKELDSAARELGISLGIFGSAALQAVTGYEYLHSQSDLDIVITPASREQLTKFHRELKDIARRYGRPFDAELKLSETCYIKLHELMSGTKTILAKGTAAPQLLSSQSIWDAMTAKP